jgi:hypothetical protein
MLGASCLHRWALSCPLSNVSNLKSQNDIFWKPASGLRADITRHRRKEQNLREYIAELEAIETRTEMEDSVLRAYRHILEQLLVSKGDVANKIGRK